MKRLSAVMALVMIGGCLGDPVDEFRAAAPSAQGIDIKMRGVNKQALGQPALMPGVTSLATFLVNGSVALALGIVASVVATQPSEVSATEVTWGPLTRPLWRNEFILTMKKGTAGVFTYEMKGRKKGAGEFVPFLEGTHTPGLAKGTGQFTIDWTAMQTLADPPTTVGKGEVSYTRTFAGDVTVDIDFVQTGAPWETTRTDSRYAYSQVEQGEGSFEFIVDSDYAAGPRLERLSVKSRWNWDGTGRSDVIGEGGDLTQPFRFSECWDAALARSYYGDTLGLFPTEGVPTACVFAEPSYTALR